MTPRWRRRQEARIKKVGRYRETADRHQIDPRFLRFVVDHRFRGPDCKERDRLDRKLERIYRRREMGKRKRSISPAAALEKA